MVKKNPPITVLMPVYKAEKYLSKAIESVLAQTFVDFEFLIINDASTDRSEEIIHSFSDSRIRYFKNKKNQNIGNALNRGVELAKGKYIARMDADDISLPDRLQRQFDFLEKNPKVDAVFSDAKIMNRLDKILKQTYLSQHTGSGNEIYSILPKKNCLLHSTAFIKTDILKKYKYRPQMRAEAWDLWLRLISDKVKIEFINEPLLHFRQHGGSLTRKYKLTAPLTVIRELSKFLSFQFKKGKFGSTERSALATLTRTFFSALPLIIRLISRSLFRTIACLWALGKTSWKDTVILFFPDYGWAGAEVVHLDITRQLFRNKRVFVIFQHPFTAKPNYREEFKKNSNGMCVLFEQNIFEEIVRSFIKFKLKRLPKTTIFGSNNAFFYHTIKGIKKHRIIDLLHLFGAGVERLALPVIDELDQRVIISKSLRQELKELYAKEEIDPKYLKRLHYIPNGIRVNPRYPEGKDFDQLHLLYVGRSAPEKRLHLIKKLINRLIENNVDFTFTAAGGDFGFCDFFSHMPQIQCLGKIERTRLKEVYKQANVLLVTSKREGFPMVMMESMTEGVIPVSTAVGGIPDNIIHSENGLLIDDYENEDRIVDAFYQNLLVLQSDKENMKQLSKATYQFAKDNFSMEKFNERYDLLFESNK
jgi:glycosyltransferase involved in cell wall biosynthesis